MKRYFGRLAGHARKTLEIDLIQTLEIEVNRAFRDTVFNGKKIVFLQ